MLKMSWTCRITIIKVESVLGTIMGKEKELLTTIKDWKLEYMGIYIEE